MSCNWGKARWHSEWELCPYCHKRHLVAMESQRKGICGMCERALEEKLNRMKQKVRE